MKKFLLILAISILFAGCHTTKKSVNTSTNTEKKTEFNQETQNTATSSIEINKQVDTSLNIQNDKNVNLKTTTKETQYYPPEPGKDIGAVKSETTTTTETQVTDKGKQEKAVKETDKGKSETKQQAQSKTNANAKEQSSEKTIVKEKTKPDRRWMWFLIIPVAVIVFVVFKKWKWIQSVLCKFTGKSQI